MKRDEVLDWVGRTVQYVREHARALAAIVIAVVVVVGAVAAVFAYRDKQTERANELLAEALIIYEAQVDALDPKPGDAKNPTFADEASRNAKAQAKLEAIHAEFEGGAIAAVAAAYLGDLAAAAGDLERAETLWREAVESVEDSMLAGRLQMNLIDLARGQGRHEAAVEELRRLLGSADSPLPGDVVLYELAGTLEELDRTDEARSAYERLIDEYEDSIYLPEARGRLDEL